MGRIGRMEDLTGPAVFLASAESDFMCAQALVIDGGWLAYGFLKPKKANKVPVALCSLFRYLLSLLNAAAVIV